MYCNTVWCTGAKSPLDSIHKIQKKIARIITFSNRREHSAPLLKSCNMLKILDINIYIYDKHIRVQILVLSRTPGQ